jgi:hypothetical protein
VYDIVNVRQLHLEEAERGMNEDGGLGHAVLWTGAAPWTSFREIRSSPIAAPIRPAD